MMEEPDQLNRSSPKSSNRRNSPQRRRYSNRRHSLIQCRIQYNRFHSRPLNSKLFNKPGHNSSLSCHSQKCQRRPCIPHNSHTAIPDRDMVANTDIPNSRRVGRSRHIPTVVIRNMRIQMAG